MTPHQKEVHEYLLKVESATKEQIYEEVSFWYYRNWEKHLGDVLSRMVKSGVIKRVKKGIYAINKSGYAEEIKNPNQLELL